jgi:CRP-like cAMP-binding protein
VHGEAFAYQPEEYMLLDGLTDEEKALFAGICRITSYKPEQVIVAEGDQGETILLIRKGRVEARKGLSEGNHKFLKELKAGDFFGEMSYLNKAPRSATVAAVDRCEILEFKMADLDGLCREIPSIGAVIYKNMAKEIAFRLKKNNEDLARAITWAMQSSVE